MDWTPQLFSGGLVAVAGLLVRWGYRIDRSLGALEERLNGHEALDTERFNSLDTRTANLESIVASVPPPRHTRARKH